MAKTSIRQGKPSAVPSDSPASPPRPNPVAVFRKSVHGYEILVDRGGRLERVATLADKTGEVGLRPNVELTQAEEAAIEAKRAVLKSILDARPQSEVHELLGSLARMEQMVMSEAEILTPQNLLDLQYAIRSFQGKLKKRLTRAD